jgi:hypothetical protein
MVGKSYRGDGTMTTARLAAVIAVTVCIVVVFVVKYGPGVVADDGAGRAASAKPIDANSQTQDPNAGNAPVLVIRTEGPEICLGRSCKFMVELHNNGYSPITIYMPGVYGYVEFTPLRDDPNTCDEYGPPVGYGRASHRDTARDFVVLEPGDYYGREFRWEPPDLGSARMICKYSNSKSGKDEGLSVWRGEIRGVKSAEVRVTGELKH